MLFMSKHCYLCPQLYQDDFFESFFFYCRGRKIHNNCCIWSNFKYVEQRDFYQFPYEAILQSNRLHCVGTSFLIPTSFFSQFIPSLVKICTDLFIMRMTVPRINFCVLLSTKIKQFYLCNGKFQSYGINVFSD